MANNDFVVKNDQQAMIYNLLAKNLIETGKHFNDTGELIQQYCGSHLKYNLSERESYQELYKHMLQLEGEFQTKERLLFEKKEKLFRTKNIGKW